jgi:hypothetical protein
MATWLRYAAHKFEYSITLSWKVYAIYFISSYPTLLLLP